MTEDWQPRWRSDPERHKEQMAARDRAYRRACKQLREEQPERWADLYELCCRLEDPPVMPRPRQTPAEILEEQIAALQRQLRRAQAGSNGHGQRH